MRACTSRINAALPTERLLERARDSSSASEAMAWLKTAAPEEAFCSAELTVSVRELSSWEARWRSWSSTEMRMAEEILSR